MADPKRYVQMQTPSIYKCDLIWEEDLRRCNQVKMKLYWIKISPNPISYVLMGRDKFGHRGTQGRPAM